MRLDFLPWGDYFMSVGFLSGMRSKDPCSQVGACVVNAEKIIVSIGYNGMPKGCSDDELPWGKESKNKLDSKYMYVCHAEMNAILNKNSTDVTGCTIYVALFPCNECAKIIIQAKITEVIYFSDKHGDRPETIASKKLLQMAKVNVSQYISKYSVISLNFNLCEEASDLEVLNEKVSDTVIPERNINKKRNDYLSWEEYFMALAFLSALRSKDPLSQTGACIVNDENRIVGIGYNGMPRGCDEKILPWDETADSIIDVKSTYVCHAVMNAILNKNCAKITGCKIYVSLFPCNECAKFIIQAGIKEIVYFSDKFLEAPEIVASKRMLNMVGVLFRRYSSALQQLRIEFNAIDWNKSTQDPPAPTTDEV